MIDYCDVPNCDPMALVSARPRVIDPAREDHQAGVSQHDPAALGLVSWLCRLFATDSGMGSSV